MTSIKKEEQDRSKEEDQTEQAVKNKHNDGVNLIGQPVVFKKGNHFWAIHYGENKGQNFEGMKHGMLVFIVTH